MLVSHTKKFIYLKTRKTAGTSIEIFFEPYCVPEPAAYVETQNVLETVSSAGIIGARKAGQAPTDRFYGHMTATDVRAEVGADIFDSYFKFCAVRNPFDRAVSLFWWQQKRNNPDWASLATAPFSAVRDAFGQFLKTSKLARDRKIYAIDGVIVVDDFIQYERLEADLARICARLGIDPSTRKLGVFNADARLRSEPYRDYYDPESVEIVTRAGAHDIARFGYAF